MLSFCSLLILFACPAPSAGCKRSQSTVTTVRCECEWISMAVCYNIASQRRGGKRVRKRMKPLNTYRWVRYRGYLYCIWNMVIPAINHINFWTELYALAMCRPKNETSDSLSLSLIHYTTANQLTKSKACDTLFSTVQCSLWCPSWVSVFHIRLHEPLSHACHIVRCTLVAKPATIDLTTG